MDGRQLNAAVRRFDRFCEDYSVRNGLQRAIARELVSKIDFYPRDFCVQKILDLGAGEGAVFRQIAQNSGQIFGGGCRLNYGQFFALDLSPSMLNMHPSSDKIVKICADFNSESDMAKLAQFAPIDLVISSCALQWAHNLDFALGTISKLAKHAAFALFTDGTFAALREFSGRGTTLLPIDEVKETLSKFYDAKIYTKNFRVDFRDHRELFSYIRKSGIGGGEKTLTIAETKKLINSYPYNYLTYETLFATAKSKSL
ncbi:hypothetical protein FACS189487_05230 [Campylobacterota bacterium]|nr:hypothetical protein FACS189487_05230 [Campylobacterota bacterium]